MVNISPRALAILAALEDQLEEPQVTVGELFLDNVTNDADALDLAGRLLVVATDLLKALRGDPALIELPRLNDTPLLFQGGLVAEARGEPIDKYGRCYSLALYAIPGGGWAIAMTYHTTDLREHLGTWALTADTAALAREHLCAWAREHRPIDLIIGFPAGAQFEPKRARIAQRLSAQLADLVQDTIAHLRD